MKPNYTELVLSALMDPNLRNQLEEQLLNDLNRFGNFKDDSYTLDWSEMVADEKAPLEWLQMEAKELNPNIKDEDAQIIVFSGIQVFNGEDVYVGEGPAYFLYNRNKKFFTTFWLTFFYNINEIPKPDYTAFGDVLGFYGMELLKKLEEQLSNDLREYGFKEDTFKFDWSLSLAETRSSYLDVYMIGFCYIYVFNGNDQIVAEGWMETINDEGENFTFAFWDHLHSRHRGKYKSLKTEPGIPRHVLNKLPLSTREKIEKYVDICIE